MTTTEVEFAIPYTTIAEIQQSRSEYQLRHFVIGQHDTPEMQFYQCCIELQSLQHSIRLSVLSAAKTEAEIAKLERGDEVDQCEAEIKRLDLQQQRLAEIGARREAAILLRILNEYPAYTREQIEQAQPEYWRRRLARQVELQQLGSRTGVGWSHLDALRQADMLDTLTTQRPDRLTA